MTKDNDTKKLKLKKLGKIARTSMMIGTITAASIAGAQTSGNNQKSIDSVAKTYQRQFYPKHFDSVKPKIAEFNEDPSLFAKIDSVQAVSKSVKKIMSPEEADDLFWTIYYARSSENDVCDYMHHLAGKGYMDVARYDVKYLWDAASLIRKLIEEGDHGNAYQLSADIIVFVRYFPIKDKKLRNLIMSSNMFKYVLETYEKLKKEIGDTLINEEYLED